MILGQIGLLCYPGKFLFDIISPPKEIVAQSGKITSMLCGNFGRPFIGDGNLYNFEHNFNEKNAKIFQMIARVYRIYISTPNTYLFSGSRGPIKKNSLKLQTPLLAQSGNVYYKRCGSPSYNKTFECRAMYIAAGSTPCGIYC